MVLSMDTLHLKYPLVLFGSKGCMCSYSLSLFLLSPMNNYALSLFFNNYKGRPLDNIYGTKWPLCDDVPLNTHSFIHSFIGVAVSTCVQAFSDCQVDPGGECRVRMASYLKACQWNKEDSSCNRASCLESIRDFYATIPRPLARDLMFCQCRPGDKDCEGTKKLLRPMCAEVETPVPACIDLIERCREELSCR